MDEPAKQPDDVAIRHDDGDGDAKQTLTAGSERVIYRNIKDFNKAIDAAAESIAKAKSPDLLGNVVWWGLILFTGFLYGVDRIFNWDLRHTLIPGIDLIDPLMVVIIGLVIWFLAWRRNQHDRILRDRLCLQCGTQLRDVEVDATGDGVCPNCKRNYNLGEYRRPDENRGTHFQGYLDTAHFDNTLFAAAEQIKKTRAIGFESDLMGLCWIALTVSFFGGLIFGWELYYWIPGSSPVNLIAFIILLIWGSWYVARMKKLGPSIIDQRRCMNCGYILLYTPINEQGLGRCSECGEIFILNQYERPTEKIPENNTNTTS